MPAGAAKPVPRLYESVRAQVIERLHSGAWAPGDRIPTESELAAEFGVGIGTIRRAVEELVTEGVLIRRARLGTTVARLTDNHRYDHYFSFVDASGKPLKPAAETLSFVRESANADVVEALRLPRGARVARIDNLRVADGHPIMLDRIWVSLDYFRGLTQAQFSSRPGSIYGFYQEQYGVSVVRVLEDLGACVADAALSKALKLPRGAPLLHVQRTAFTYNDTPIEFRHRYVNARVCRYRNVRGLEG
jgi:GntR family transcriptional regulator